MRNGIDLNRYVNTLQIPEDEVEKQYYYMAKCSQHVTKLAEKLGHTPTCCVTTFGCQMNVEPVKA